VAIPLPNREIPRVWEVDWAIPPEEGGTPWAGYDWLLQTAAELQSDDVTIVAPTYQRFDDLWWTIGEADADALRLAPHTYVVDGIVVHGVTPRGSWRVRGPVLVAWANDEILTKIENRRVVAIPAVASWPSRIAAWRAIYAAARIGQERPDQETDR
jgi:hypothetical protein